MWPPYNDPHNFLGDLIGEVQELPSIPFRPDVTPIYSHTIIKAHFIHRVCICYWNTLTINPGLIQLTLLCLIVIGSYCVTLTDKDLMENEYHQYLLRQVMEYMLYIAYPYVFIYSCVIVLQWKVLNVIHRTCLLNNGGLCCDNCHALVINQRNTPWFDLRAEADLYIGADLEK